MKPIHLWRILFALFGLWSLTACALNKTPVAPPVTVEVSQTALANIEDLITAQSYSAALAELDKITVQNADTITRRGEIYLAQGRLDVAHDAFERALKLDPNNVTATLGLAQTLLAQNKAVDSRLYWRQAMALNGTISEPWLGLGKSYLAVGDYNAAQNAFMQAHRLAPNAESAWYLAALIAPQDVASAQRYLAQIETLTPAQNHLQKTLASLSSQTDPAETALISGIALIQLNEWQLARRALNLAVEQDPKRAEAWAFLGHTQSKLGLPAIESFSTAAALEPDLALVPYFEGLYLRQQGLNDVALEKFLYALDLDPANLAVALETAQTLTEMGDYRSAEAWYQSVVEAEPDSVEYQQALTQFYVNRSYRIEENGLPSAQKLVEMAPNRADAYDLLGWAEYQTGDFTAAEQALQQAIQLQANHIPAHYHLGRVLLALRRNTEAEIAFTFVLDHDTSGVYRNRILEGN